MENAILTKWISSFGGPGTIISDKDPRLTGAQVLQFCRYRNGALQTVIPGRHRSLGDIGAGHRYLKYIKQRIIDGEKGNAACRDRLGYSSMFAMRLNSQVQPYGGFNHGGGVFDWPKNYRAVR